MRTLQRLVTFAVVLTLVNDAAAVCKAKALFRKVKDCSNTLEGLNASTLRGLDPGQLFSQQSGQVLGIISEAIYPRQATGVIAPGVCACTVVAKCDMGDHIIACGATGRLPDNSIPGTFRLQQALPTLDANVFGCQACGCNQDQTASITLTSQGYCLRGR